MIDVRKLRMLAALDRLGTIAAVAKELHLTAPGVSMQLGALERELGIALTERQGRRLALTPAGRLLAHHGRDVIDRLSLAELEIDALRRGDAGTYRVAAFPSAGRTFVADAWRELLSDGAGMNLLVTTLEPETPSSPCSPATPTSLSCTRIRTCLAISPTRSPRQASPPSRSGWRFAPTTRPRRR